MTSTSLTTARRLAALSAALLLQAPAQAGLVTGAWDPAFGAALPGLSWAAYAEVLVPDNGCTNLDGNPAITGACAGARIQAVFLRLYETAVGAPDWSDPGSYDNSVPLAATFSACDTSVIGNAAYTDRCRGNHGNYFTLDALRVERGNVVGLQASVAALFRASVDTGNGPVPTPTSALGNSFTLDFAPHGPQLTCTTCAGGPVRADLEGLRQFLVTYNSSDASAPKYTDARGNALGALLNSEGEFLGLAASINDQPVAVPVPEPGGLALVATALAAAALLRRRGR